MKFIALLALLLTASLAMGDVPGKTPASQPVVIKDLAAELGKVPAEMIPPIDQWTMKAAGTIDDWLKKDMADATIDLVVTVDSVRKSKDGASAVCFVELGKFDKWGMPVEKVLMQVTIPKEGMGTIAHIGRGEKIRITHGTLAGVNVNLNTTGIVGAKDSKVKSLNVILNVNAAGVRAVR